MKKYKKLIVYDFDDTMFKTPGPECYLTVRQLAHDKLPDINDINQDYYSWWDHPVSLDTGLFQICAIGPHLP